MLRAAETSPSFWKFAFAKEFKQKGFGAFVSYRKNSIEKCGDFLRLPMRAADFLLRERRSPLLWASLTLVAVGVATLAYYPQHTIGLLHKLVPLTRRINIWHFRDLCYWISVSVILGTGCRAAGRRLNQELYSAWNRNLLEPIYLGAQLIKHHQPLPLKDLLV